LMNNMTCKAAQPKILTNPTSAFFLSHRKKEYS